MLQETGNLERRLEARQQALAVVEGCLEASRSLVSAILVAVHGTVEVPVEVQQAIASGPDAERAAAVEQLPILVTRSPPVDKKAD